MKILKHDRSNYSLFYDKFVYNRGREALQVAERIPARQIQRWNRTLNLTRKKFFRISSRIVKIETKKIMMKNLRDFIRKALLKILHYDLKKAKKLFKVVYPKANFNSIVRRVTKRLRRIRFNVTSEDVLTIRNESTTKFANLIFKACGLKAPDEFLEDPLKNLGSNLAKAKGATKAKIERGISKRNKIGKLAVQKSIKYQMTRQIRAQLKDVMKTLV